MGRESDILRLTKLINDPQLGPGHLRLVQLDGEIGVGKRALLSAVVGRLRLGEQTATPRPSPHVFLAHGNRLHADAPLTAFRVFCEDLLGDSLECLLDTATPAVLALRCLETLGRTPLVLAVDDAHSLDPASSDFLETLIQHPAQGPVTILAVHRLGRAPRNLVVAANRRGALHDHHTVEALPDEAIARIADELPNHQATAVVNASNGNPLFAHTAIAGFRRQPDAEKVEEVLRTASHTRTAALSSSITTDLDTLTEPARRTLETLAMLGDTDTANIAKVTDLHEDDVRAGAQELAERGLTVDSPHEVLHPMVRLSVYQNTEPTRRTEFHRRAARLPHTELFDRAEHLAGALVNSGDATSEPLTEREVDVLIDAARVAIGSDPRAVRRWLGSLPSRSQTPQSEMLLARAMILTGDFDEAIGHLRALVEYEDSPEAQILLVNALRMTGHTDEARALLASKHQWANGADPTLLREYIDVLALIDGQAPDDLLSKLESLPDTAGDGLNRAVAAIYRTMTLLSEGRVPQARVVFQRVNDWAEGASNDDLASVPHATCAAVWAAYILDQFSFGASLASRALHLARRHGQADALANLGTGLAFCQATLGLIDQAEEASEQAIRDAEKYGPSAMISMARAGLMIAAQGRNDMSRLKLRFDDLVNTPLPEFGWFRRAVLTTRTRVSAMLGDPEPCLELLGKPKDAMAALRYADAAIVAAAQGDGRTAQALLNDGITIAHEQEQHGQRAMILTTEAELLLRSGNPLRAGNLLRAARDIFEERDMRLQLWRAQAGIARAEAALAEQTEPLAQLTKREREVAEVIAEGLSNKQVAERLVLSHRTVENHIRNILKKLGAESRQEIVEIATLRAPTP